MTRSSPATGSRYGVSDGTVKRAMRELREQGLVRTYQGKGSFKA